MAKYEEGFSNSTVTVDMLNYACRLDLFRYNICIRTNTYGTGWEEKKKKKKKKKKRG